MEGKKKSEGGGGIAFIIPFDDKKSTHSQVSNKSDQKLKRLAQRSKSRSKSIKKKMSQSRASIAQSRDSLYDSGADELDFKFKTRSS